MLKEKRESIPSQTGDGSEDVELRTANDKVDDHHHEDVPALEPVASYRTSMMGYMVGVLVTFSRSLKGR